MSSQKVGVFARIRPPGGTVAVTGPATLEHDGKQYGLAGVLGPDATQQQTYDTLCRDFADAVRRGHSCALFAYGQTGSGKTHSVSGTRDDEGILHRLIGDVLALDLPGARVVLSALEIGADPATGRTRLRDLLREGPDPPEVRASEDGPGTVVRPLFRTPVACVREARDVFRVACASRTVRSTDMNAESSRSHAVYRVAVEFRTAHATRTSVLDVVDLAGTERLASAGTGDSKGGRQEAIRTNTELMALGRVVHALEQGAQHVPYRDSVLTRILQPQFVEGIVRVLLCLRADGKDAGSTQDSLNFGRSAMSISLTPVTHDRAVGRADLCAHIQSVEKRAAELEELMRAAVARADSAAAEAAARVSAEAALRISDDSSEWESGLGAAVQTAARRSLDEQAAIEEATARGIEKMMQKLVNMRALLDELEASSAAAHERVTELETRCGAAASTIREQAERIATLERLLAQFGRNK